MLILPEHQARILKEVERAVYLIALIEVSKAEYVLITHISGPPSRRWPAEINQVSEDVGWATDFVTGKTDRRQALRDHILEDSQVARSDRINEEGFVIQIVDPVVMKVDLLPEEIEVVRIQELTVVYLKASFSRLPKMSARLVCFPRLLWLTVSPSLKSYSSLRS